MTMQQSEEQATRNGIMALEQAYAGVQRCQHDVQSTSSDLASSYGGSDGGKYRALLEQWDGHVDTILLNLNDMVDELNTTLVEHGLVQSASSEVIDQEHSQSATVFDELSGTGVSGG